PPGSTDSRSSTAGTRHPPPTPARGSTRRAPLPPGGAADGAPPVARCQSSIRATYIVTSGAHANSSNSGVSHSVSSTGVTSFRRWIAGGADSLRECEGDQRAAVAGAEHPGQEALGPAAPADGDGDVLPPVHAVGRGAAVVAAAA